jgi:hypothetical protein
MTKFEARIHLATVALASFIVSFISARIFTTVFPSRVLISGGFHIHHFWFGLVLLAIGGWLGINYEHKDIGIVAAILYGVGGGLIVDEVGLLLTFGNYQSGLTWDILIFLLSFFSILILFFRYRNKIVEELSEFTRSKIGLVFGIFLAAVSTGFVAETNNIVVIVASAGLTIFGIILIVIFIIQRNMKMAK